MSNPSSRPSLSTSTSTFPSNGGFPTTTTTSSTSSSLNSSTPSTKKNLLSLSPACNFEAFSHHFHLPLKTAAEKFGVRATAFKKRCRAIGIRHWPYRKVRSLKRSIQELNRCKEQGVLNDKQQFQYATFKKQLDKLMAPETYGIDPSGRLPTTHQSFDDDGNEDEDSGDDDSFASQSPRYTGTTFAECSISPADTEKTFGDFSGPSHLRSFRKQPSFRYKPYSNDIPNMSQRLPVKEPSCGSFKYPYGGYDQFLHESHSSMEKSFPSSSSSHTSAFTFEEEHTSYADHHHGNGLLEVSSTHEFAPSECRSFQDHDEEFHETISPHIDYNSERFFDDVFLQISPDYGCLV